MDYKPACLVLQNKDDRLSMDEFMEGSTQDPKIVAALSLYNINSREDKDIGSEGISEAVESEAMETEATEQLERVDVEDIMGELSDEKESENENDD